MMSRVPDGDRCVLGGHICVHQPTRHVAGGVHVWIARLHELVDDDLTAWAEGHPGFVETHAARVGPPSQRDQELLGSH